MKTPPFLLFTTLLFWGWQADLFIVGGVLGALLEGARWTTARWDLSDEDFSRIWTFCTLFFLAAAVYAFTDNGGVDTFRGLLQTSSLSAQRHAGAASAKTAAAIIRWLPMIFFLFVAAQAYSTREEIPFYTISLILQRRWRKAKKAGRTLPPGRGVNIAYPYFALCLFAASVHAADDNTFFYGTVVLVVWALWPYRSRRFGLVFWTCALAVGITLGYFGQTSIGMLQRYAAGNFSAQWLMELLHSRSGADPTQSKTEIGQIGRVKTSMKIVIRLEPREGAVPTYLREASYRSYRSHEKAAVWIATPAKLDFDNVPSERDGFTWVLIPGKTNVAAVNIACYLSGGSGLLPLPERSGRLEKLPAYIMRKNSAGAVFIDGPGLVIFDALYGPGATIDSPPTDLDTALPSKEIPALDEVVTRLELKDRSAPHVLHALNGFFQDKFTYRMWQDGSARPRTNETAIGRFLLHTHAGHCEYFATSTVLLLRHLGIPARYAVGYVVHEASGKNFVVRERDAHAWCLVWDGKAWQNFDTTPASWLEEEDHGSTMQWAFDAWSWMGFQVSKLRWGQGHLREWILAAVIPVLIVLLYQIIRKRRRQRGAKARYRERATVWPGVDSEFYQIEKQIAQRGVVRHANEPLSDWLERAVADPGLSELRRALQALLRLHYRYRFDPEGLSQSDREELRREARECLERLSATGHSQPAGRG